MSTLSKLDFIRLHNTFVSCDSFDIDTLKEFGPFDNCTSNQAIIHGEWVKASSADIISQAAHLARRYDFDEERCIKYGVRAMIIRPGHSQMVLLALRTLPYISESVLLQSSMHAAYSRDKTVEDVRAIISLFRLLSPETPLDRICIKIPATYEGLEACRILNTEGIKTLATCVFSLEQAILAAEVGCCFLSPYVNELKVHFTPNMIDEHKLFPTIRQIYEYYEDHGINTKIILGSFVSSEEVMEVSGIHGVTLPPSILKEMSSTPVSAGTTLSYLPRLSTNTVIKAPEYGFLDNEDGFKKALSEDKEATRKLEEAITFFLGLEKNLETNMKSVLIRMKRH